ncbi:hypothetical protein HMPREF1544_10457 [Mucor circinelloides 1006PhL]|uniref:DUF6987 domain-containing protein n=1 Tax=Mucor circinelloides f. circinelloides (strain 1006PhL) TaxID=1220926 RepID=S2JJW2_MUCC1|nr:hypothetical protein HMPREF1544_10457 [Mucor circinelloides 1006PhL]
MKNQQAKQQEAAAAMARAANSGDEAVEGQQQQQQQPPAAQGQDAQNEEESPDQQDQGDDQSDDNQEQEQQASEEEEDDEEESEEEEEESNDEEELEELYRLMVGKKINKAGLVVDKKSGAVLGKIAEGKLKRMAGKKVRDNGEVYNDKGKLIGRVEPVQEDSDDDDDDESDNSEADDNAEADNNAEAATKNDEEDAPADDAIKNDAIKDDAIKDDNTLENEAKSAAEDAADDTEDKAGEANDEANDAVDDLKKAAEDTAEDAEGKADDVKQPTKDVASDAEDNAEEAEESTKDIASDTEDQKDDSKKATENVAEDVADAAKDTTEEAEDAVNDAEDTAKDTKERDVKQDAENAVEDLEVGDNDDKASDAEQDEEKKPFNPYDLVDENSPEVRKSGKVVDMEDNVVGTVDKGMAPKLAGFKVDKDGNVVNHEGHIVAKAELYKTEEEPKQEEDEDKPFNPNENVNEDSPEVRKSGKIVDMEDNVVGTIDKEQAPKFAGFKVDKDGNVINHEGHIVAKADLYKTEEDEKPFNPNEMVNADSPEVRKSGKVFDMDDNLVGYVDKRVAAKLAGMKVDETGNVINDEGHIVGKADMIKPEPEEEEPKEEEKRFNPNEAVDEDSPEVKKSGKILDMDDNLVGHIDKKLAAKLVGFKVDPQGNVIDNDGHIVATAEMIKEPEQEEEKKPFNPNENVNEDSPEVKKSGKILDMDDEVVGHIDKKLAAKLAGLKVDPQGNVIDNDGHIVATAEMIQPEEEKKPFNPNDAVDENSPEVKRSGKVVDMDDNIVGSVDKRLAPKLVGFKVDDDGNVINNEGHIVAKAEMIPAAEEEDPNKPFNPNTMVDEHSPRVRKSGKVVDEDDNIVGEVDKSSAHKLAGFPVDDDGNIIDNDGHIVGKAKMHGKKSEEQLKEEAEEEEYRKIADQMSQSIQTSLDKIKPILKNITDIIDEEEAKPQKERDEQKLVDTVKPLIEQGSAILEECNGAIRGLDPSGRIAKQAQAKTSARKATPEEYHLADLLAQLSGEVSTTIDRAKKKVRSMPHAKKELSPLWNILQSPLLQILSAVGLLLTGVLGLVGNILNGLGLGSIINGLLGGIGLNKILEGFGLGDALKLGGKK